MYVTSPADLSTAESTLLHWINERWSIFQKKESGQPKPWTNDPILQRYRFCNVHRENDRVTRWIKRYWRDPHAANRELTAAMVLARLLNRIETLQYLGFPAPWNAVELRRKLHGMAGDKMKIFSAAYVVTTCGAPMSKIDYVVDLATNVRVSDVVPGYGGTLGAFHKRLTKFHGLGSFLAAQVVADLKNVAGNPLERAVDRAIWAAPGPGSLRGIKAATGQPVTPGAFLPKASALREKILPHLHPDIPEIDMQDFQNCLCEFDKYWRTVHGRGRPKQDYPGNH